MPDKCPPHQPAPEIRHEGPTMIYFVTLCLKCGATLKRRMQPKPKK